MARRVSLEVSESPYINEVEISAGGETYRSRIRRADYLGSARNPLSQEQLEAKFLRNASGVVGESRARQLAERFAVLEELDGIRELTRLFLPSF